jgi:hypothetical protein
MRCQPYPVLVVPAFKLLLLDWPLELWLALGLNSAFK